MCYNWGQSCSKCVLFAQPIFADLLGYRGDQRGSQGREGAAGGCFCGFTCMDVQQADDAEKEEKAEDKEETEDATFDFPAKYANKNAF